MDECGRCLRLDPKSFERFSVRVGDQKLISDLSLLVTTSTPAYWAKYRFGDLLVQGGRFRPPCTAEGCEPCRELEVALEKHGVAIPLALVLSGTVEVFVASEEHRSAGSSEYAPTEPLRVLETNELFGVFETLDSLWMDGSLSSPRWDLSAGPRSLVLLRSKESAGFADVFDMWTRNPPRGVGNRDEYREKLEADAWGFLRFVNAKYQHDTDGNNSGSTEVLLFPFAGKREKGPAKSQSVRLRIAEIGWSQSRHFRDHRAEWDSVFGNEYLLRKRKVLPAKHRLAIPRVLNRILAIAQGDLPGFVRVDPGGEGYLESGIRRIGAVFTIGAREAEKILDGEGNLPETGSRSVLLLRPTHLRKAGEVAHVSLLYQLVPWLRSEDPGKRQAFALDLNRAIRKMETQVLERNLTHCLFGRDALNSIAVDESEKKISSKNRFLQACIRVVRA